MSLRSPSFFFKFSIGVDRLHAIVYFFGKANRSLAFDSCSARMVGMVGWRKRIYTGIPGNILPRQSVEEIETFSQYAASAVRLCNVFVIFEKFPLNLFPIISFRKIVI